MHVVNYHVNVWCTNRCTQTGIQAAHTVPTCYGPNECNDRIPTEHGFHSSCDLPLRWLWMLFSYFRQFDKWKTSFTD